MSGFFRQSEVIGKAPIFTVPRCGECGLYKSCNSPKMPVSGRGERKILIVGEAPGEDEDEQGTQFVGETGSLLKRTLGEFGCEMRRDCWLTNSLICRPPGNEIENKKMIGWCRPNLVRTIRELNPEIVILCGTVAVQSMIPIVWKDDDIGGIMKWAGFRIPCQRPNMWICPVYHPSFVSRSLSEKQPKTQVDVLWRKHLKAALKLRGRPWDVVPEWEKEIIIIRDSDAAADAVDDFRRAGRPIAFDYEGNTLKADNKQGLIVSCAISDGKRTISFPWYGNRLIRAMDRLLLSDVPKIAANIKHEERWTRRVFGHPVNNWLRCTMTTAHIEDCRPGITGLKFQAFVQLGARSYDDKIKPFLRAGKNITINRILEEVDLDRLLLYGGLDALLEIKLGRKQMQRAGLEFPK